MDAKKLFNVVMYVLSIITLIFKIYDYKGANEIFIISSAFMIYSLFKYAIADNALAGMSNRLNYFLVGLLLITIISIVFKNMHWHGLTILVFIDYLFFICTPILLVFQKDSACVSKQFMIIYSLQMLYIITLMRHNPIVQFLENSI